MSPDQILVGIGMVKAVTEELNRSMDRLVDIGEHRAIGQITPSRAKEMIKTERDTPTESGICCCSGLHRPDCPGQQHFYRTHRPVVRRYADPH